MDNLILALTNAAGPWGVSFATLFGVVWWFFGDLHNQKGRDWWIGLLQERDMAGLYRQMLMRALSSFPQGLYALSEFHSSWSYPLLKICLGIALIYPTFCVVAFGILTGQGAAFGRDAGMFPPPSDRPVALATLAHLVLALGLILGGKTLIGRDKIDHGLVVLLLSLLPLIQCIRLLDAAIVGDEGLSLLRVYVFAITMLALVPVRWFLSLFVALLIACVTALVFFFLLATVEFHVNRPVAFLVACVASGATLKALIFCRVWLELHARVTIDLIVLVGVWGGAIALSVSLISDPISAVVLLLVLIWPILNALADFASAGATLHFLAAGLRGGMLRAVLCDCCAAIAIRAVLGAAMIVSLVAVAPRDDPFLTPAAFIHEVADPANSIGNHAWLYACLFTTALPTIAHLGLSVFAGAAILAQRSGLGLAKGLTSRIETVGRLSSLAFVLALSAALWAPAFLIWHAFVWTGPVLIGTLFRIWAEIPGLVGA